MAVVSPTVIKLVRRINRTFFFNEGTQAFANTPRLLYKTTATTSPAVARVLRRFANVVKATTASVVTVVNGKAFLRIVKATATSAGAMLRGKSLSRIMTASISPEVAVMKKAITREVSISGTTIASLYRKTSVKIAAAIGTNLASVIRKAARRVSTASAGLAVVSKGRASFKSVTAVSTALSKKVIGLQKKVTGLSTSVAKVQHSFNKLLLANPIGVVRMLRKKASTIKAVGTYLSSIGFGRMVTIKATSASSLKVTKGMAKRVAAAIVLSTASVLHSNKIRVVNLVATVGNLASRAGTFINGFLPVINSVFLIKLPKRMRTLIISLRNRV
jgi:hypothetical protein